MTLRVYRDMLKAEAKARRLEGESQTQIARALGVTQRTVSRWLNGSLSTQDIVSNGEGDRRNVLPTTARPLYLVVESTVEKFRPPDGITFPLIVADPPWNVSDVGHIRERKVRPHPFTKDFGSWDAIGSDRAYLAKSRQWLQALYKVAARDAWLFFWCSYRYISYIGKQAEAIGWRTHTFYIWHKTNPMPLFGNNNYLQSIEMALVLVKGNPRFRFGKRGGKQPPNFMESPQVGGLERVKVADGSTLNIAQKPLGLCRLWIDQASKRGDWILDAFAGTGTASIAALRQGRNACAVELDAALVKSLEARILRECPVARPLQ